MIERVFDNVWYRGPASCGGVCTNVGRRRVFHAQLVRLAVRLGNYLARRQCLLLDGVHSTVNDLGGPTGGFR